MPEYFFNINIGVKKIGADTEDEVLNFTGRGEYRIAKHQEDELLYGFLLL